MPTDVLTWALQNLPADFFARDHTLCPPECTVRLRAASQKIRQLLHALAVNPPTAVTAAPCTHGDAIVSGLRALHTWSCVVSVTISRTGLPPLSDTQIVDVLQALRHAGTVERLDLQGNDILYGETIARLAETVAQNPNLHVLNLAHNQIGKFLSTLCRPLLKHNAVTVLNLSNNGVAVQSLWCLAVFRHLRVLDLSHNNLGVFVRILFVALQYFDFLEVLQLEDTNLCDAESGCLFDALRVYSLCPALRCIGLQHNHLGANACRKLDQFLATRDGVCCVNICYNKIGGEGYEAVAGAVNRGVVRCSYNRILFTCAQEEVVKAITTTGCFVERALRAFCEHRDVAFDLVYFTCRGQVLTGQEILGERVAGTVYSLSVTDASFLGVGDVEVECRAAVA